MKDKIKKYIKTHENDMLEDLQDLVAIPSVSDDRENVVKALRFTLDLAEEYGFKAESFLDDQVGVIEMGEGDETLGILTHVDVVPPGDLAEWDTDPFEAEDIGGRMYGRGTIDDKGMVIACLYAMRAVKELGLPFHKKVQLIMGTQEEVEWTDMDAYVREYPLPDYGFTPDGEYPICNIEKGFIDQEMEFDVMDDVTPEGLYLKGFDIGIASNVVPDKAEALLSDGEKVVSRGKACHSSVPGSGENVIFELAKELKTRDLAFNKLLDLLYAVTEDMSDWQGSGLGLSSESEYYQGEFVHRNTFAPTIFRASDGRAELTLNMRPAYGADMDHIMETVDSWAKAHGGRTVSTDAQRAVFVSKERPFLKVFAESYEKVSGRKNDFSLEYGGTYAKAMPNIVSWGPLFPGEEDTCHQVNEYIDIHNMMLSSEIFALSIAGIALSEESFK